MDATIQAEAIADVAASEWMGSANRLSVSHVEWKIIDEVARCTNKERTAILHFQESKVSSAGRSEIRAQSAEQIIQQRRSAVAMDGKTSISSEMFFRCYLESCPR